MQYEELARRQRACVKNAEKAWFAICNAGGSPADLTTGRDLAGVTPRYKAFQRTLRRGLSENGMKSKEDRYKDRIYR